MSESYTPGHTRNASDFMSRRTLESHGQFFLPYVGKGLAVLDCGCGPGTITLGLAECCAPGVVVGVDAGQSQIERAGEAAIRKGVRNVQFERASCYDLPFHDAAFDRVFSHALLEHLSEPIHALRELHRVLRAGGIIGVCSPDWGGLLLSPLSPEVTLAVERYAALQSRNGGDLRIGRKLGPYLTQAGFESVRMSARYECYSSPAFIAEYLALQLEQEEDTVQAAVLRRWSQDPSAMFAQAWVSAVGTRT
jgi:SAM-dependent methyltransferase